jgi:hypothetical protein
MVLLGFLGTDAAVAQLGEHCSDVKVLSLKDCVNVTDRGLAALNKLSQLHTLNLYRVPDITDAGLQGLCKGLASLRDLNLLQCARISDKSLVQLAVSCRQLTALNIQDCVLVRYLFRCSISSDFG